MTATTPITTLILTPEQHAQLRDYLEALMAYAEVQHHCRPNHDASDREDAYTATLDAANALDLLDTAAAKVAAMVRDAAGMDWLSRVDGSVKH